MPLVTGDSPAQFLVPTDDSLGLTWTEAAFVPGAEWTSETGEGQPVTAAMGYEGLRAFRNTSARTSKPACKA